jgi:hypothetical protein
MYIFVKLFHQNEVKDQIIWNEIMFSKNWSNNGWQSILVDNIFLKFKFDIFSFPKINIWQNWIRIYECVQNKLYMQNVIFSLLQIENIIWIN